MTDGFIDEEDALRIHSEQIASFGGGGGVLNRDNLLSALGSVINAYNYGIEDIAELAVYYMTRIAQAHAFVDGNKRTAASCALHFLEFHDVEFTMSNEDYANLILAIVEGKVTHEEAIALVAEHCAEKQPVSDTSLLEQF